MWSACLRMFSRGPAGDGLKSLGLESIERQVIRIGGLEPYVLVSALTSTASYDTFCSLDTTQLDLATLLLFFSLLGSILCGLYSTIIFSLSILYAKTALGMDRDQPYSYFLEQTATKRKRGFAAFSASLSMFCCNVLILAVQKLPPDILIPSAIVSLAILIFGIMEWRDMIDAAMPIFSNVVPTSNDEDATQRKKK